MRIKKKSKAYLGDCRDEKLVEKLFGSVPEFAGLVELLGEDFSYGKVCVEYDSDASLHIFYALVP